jgi:transcriptional regulator with XRE-family HTH domain
MLINESIRRGDTLAELARHLGVTYGRIAQWRRQEGSLKVAHPSVLTAAAQYLRVPRIVAMTLAGVISLEDLLWPSPHSREQRMQWELEKLQRDPLLGPFVPASLGTAAPDLRTFVAFLYREVQSADLTNSSRGTHWVAELMGSMVQTESRGGNWQSQDTYAMF